MAKPVARFSCAKSAWGIDHGIDFLVLTMAFFGRFLKLIFLPFSVLIKTPSKSISDIDFEGAIIN